MSTPALAEEVVFRGAGGADLHGVLHVPGGTARGSVLLTHCFTCSKDLHTTTRLASSLQEAGYAVLRFDFTGIGESGGSFAGTTVGTDVRDVARAATTLVERGYGPCSVVGHSLGGAAALLAAHRLKTVRSVVVLGSPSSPGHVRRLFVDHEHEIEREGVATVSIAGRPFPISSGFVEDLEAHDQARRVAELDRPLLVIHAVDDDVVPIAEGERIFASARQPKGFLPVLGADHLLTGRDAARRVAGAVLDWLDATS